MLQQWDCGINKYIYWSNRYVSGEDLRSEL